MTFYAVEARSSTSWWLSSRKVVNNVDVYQDRTSHLSSGELPSNASTLCVEKLGTSVLLCVGVSNLSRGNCQVSYALFFLSCSVVKVGISVNVHIMGCSIQLIGVVWNLCK